MVKSPQTVSYEILAEARRISKDVDHHNEIILRVNPEVAKALRGPEREDHVLYSSYTMWRSHADFEAWTKSESFRKAHARAGSQKPTTLGHPEFEGIRRRRAALGSRMSGRAA